MVGGEWDSDTACEYKVIGILEKNPWAWYNSNTKV